MTYVCRADGFAVINRALDDAGFHPSAVHAEGLTAASRPDAGLSALARSLVGQVPHDVHWPERIAELLA